MKTIDFLSNRTYILLPRKSDAKVYLPIGNTRTIHRAFKLYNPFSKKAKILKKLSLFLCLYMKPVARILLPTTQGKKSKFLVYISKKLSKKIVSSVYIATAKDKLVLQLQEPSGIIGYLKYPISEIGTRRLLNEQKAIALLSKKKLIPPILLAEEYNGVPFIVLQNLDGTIGEVSDVDYRTVLEKFKTTRKFQLKNHPRIIGLINKLKALGLLELKTALEKLANATDTYYHEVNEHGDFAAWNLIQTKEGLVPFDFEYFEEKGLAYLDEIKFHFQEQHLLHKKSGLALIKAIAAKIDIEEFNSIFKIYVLKEIVNKAQENESFDYEKNLLALVP